MFSKNKYATLILVSSQLIIHPESYILAALSDKERLEAAFAISAQAFKGTRLTEQDINSAVKNIRKKLAKYKNAKRRH